MAARKRVDGLGVVADAGDARAVGAQQRDDVGLQGVRILELVDQHVVEALAHARAARRVGEEPAPEQQQVVVVEHLLLLLEVGVAGEELRQAFLGRQAPGEGRVQHLAQRQLRVDAARVHVEAGGLLREARAAAAEAEGRAGDVHEVFRVAAVEDREVGLPCRCRGRGCAAAGRRSAWKVPPQTRAEAPPEPPPARRQHRLDAPQHLGGRAAREGEQQDAPRVGAAAR